MSLTWQQTAAPEKADDAAQAAPMLTDAQRRETLLELMEASLRPKSAAANLSMDLVQPMKPSPKQEACLPPSSDYGDQLPWQSETMRLTYMCQGICRYYLKLLDGLWGLDVGAMIKRRDLQLREVIKKHSWLNTCCAVTGASAGHAQGQGTSTCPASRPSAQPGPCCASTCPACARAHPAQGQVSPKHSIS